MCIDTATKIPKTLAKILEEKFWRNIPRLQAFGAPSGQRLAMPSTLAKPLRSSLPKAKVSSSKDVKEREGTMK